MFHTPMDSLEVARAIHSFLEIWSIIFFGGLVACEVIKDFFIGDKKGPTLHVQWRERWLRLAIGKHCAALRLPAHTEEVSVKSLLKKHASLWFAFAVLLEFTAHRYSATVDELADKELFASQKQVVAALVTAGSANVEAGTARRDAGTVTSRVEGLKVQAKELEKGMVDARLETEQVKKQGAAAVLAAEQAKTANLAMEERIAPRILEQASSAQVLGGLKGITFRISFASDPETERTAEQIMFLLHAAGWGYSTEIANDRVTGPLQVFNGAFAGIFIEANLPQIGVPDLSRAAATALRDQLAISKIDAVVISRGALPNRPRFQPGAINIHVGLKPLVTSGNGIRGNMERIPE